MKEPRTITNRFTGAIIATGTETQSLAELAASCKANLAEANLTEANLTEANLTEANLTEANLTRANLAEANLAEANLTRANLTRANLTRANLTRANLTRANLTQANLTEANLTEANLAEANLTEANLAEAKYGDYTFTGKFCQLVSVAEWGPMLVYEAVDHGLRIMLGCRHFSIAEAREHWKERDDRKMTSVALEMAEAWYKGISQGVSP